MAKIVPTGHEVSLGSWEILELISFEVEVNGKKKMFERARRPPWVRVIISKDNKVLLSREYRRELWKYDYRLPGGKVIDTLKEWKDFHGDIEEKAKEAVIREAREEAGVDIRNPTLFHISHCGSNIEWDLYYFVATEFEEHGNHEHDDEGESDMTTCWYTFDEINEKIVKNEMSEDRSVGVLMRWMMRRG